VRDLIGFDRNRRIEEAGQQFENWRRDRKRGEPRRIYGRGLCPWRRSTASDPHMNAAWEIRGSQILQNRLTTLAHDVRMMCFRGFALRPHRGSLLRFWSLYPDVVWRGLHG
jgi:hypothetical protein